jgi:hypothetical protein
LAEGGERAHGAGWCRREWERERGKERGREKRVLRETEEREGVHLQRGTRGHLALGDARESEKVAQRDGGREGGREGVRKQREARGHLVLGESEWVREGEREGEHWQREARGHMVLGDARESERGRESICRGGREATRGLGDARESIESREGGRAFGRDVGRVLRVGREEGHLAGMLATACMALRVEGDAI